MPLRLIPIFALLASAPALAQGTDGASNDARSAALNVMELFTSQSCSSCPPAEKLLRELAQRSDLLALEFHVDYWDDLAVRDVGAWKDPFSQNAFTERQRQYNQRIRGRRAVYTPQLAIDGEMEMVCPDRRRIEGELAQTEAPTIQIDVAAENEEISVEVEGAPNGAEVVLVTFIPSAVTTVKAGENYGKELKETNIVQSLTPIGRVSTNGGDLSFKPMGGELSCAVIIQSPETGKVHGGAYCPRALAGSTARL